MNIAKKLRNVVIFDGDNEEFNEFIEGVKKAKMKIVPVQVPKVMSEIDASYINSKWNNKSMNEAIIYGKNKDKGIVAFADNEKNKKIVYDIIRSSKLNVKTSRFVSDSTEGEIITTWYEKGKKVRVESERISTSKFSVARCLK